METLAWNLAPLEDRIVPAIRQQNLPRDEVTLWSENAKRKRIEFVKAQFFKNATAPSHYDLVSSSPWSSCWNVRTSPCERGTHWKADCAPADDLTAAA